MPIQIFSHHADQIRKAAADALLHECCGLLLGVDHRILEVVSAANIAADPLFNFEVDPETLLATHRRARAEGLMLLGSYHSHPSGSLTPSARDAAQATESMRIWLIASADRLTAWKWRVAANFTKMDLVEIA